MKNHGYQFSNCPKCVVIATKKQIQLDQEATEAYGKVPESDYRATHSLLAVTYPQKGTLQEEWNIGISDDGVFTVEFRALCHACGWKHEHKNSKRVVDLNANGTCCMCGKTYAYDRSDYNDDAVLCPKCSKAEKQREANKR